MKNGWTTIALGVVSALLGGAVAYGVLKTKIDEHDRRLESHGLKIDGKIDRTEFEARRLEIVRRIERIEK